MTDYLWNIMMRDGGFELLSLLALAAAKATFLLASVALIVLTFRRLSAATRHLLWSIALCGSLVLPFLSSMGFWEVPVLPAHWTANAFVLNETVGSEELPKMSESLTPSRETFDSNALSGARPEPPELQIKAEPPEGFAGAVETSERQIPPPIDAASPLPSLINWALAVWLAGAVLLLFRLFAGAAASDFLVRRGRGFEDAALNEAFSALCAELNLKNKVRLLHAEGAEMPVACGVFRPVVLLPAGAEKWTAERQRMVLLHELAHVARRDCLTQQLAQAACAIYWFNPFVWMAARRLRVERERACDERVLSLGTKPSAYAHQLLEIARLMQEEQKSSIFEWSQTTSVAMARRSQLEGRLLAILREGRRFEAQSSRAATIALIALMSFFLFSTAVVRPTTIGAQNAPSPKMAFVVSPEETTASLPGSLPVSEQENETAIRNAEDGETIKKQNDSGFLVEPSGQYFGDRQIDKTDAPNSPVPISAAPQQEISQPVQTPTAPSIQTLEASAPNAPENNPFIKAEYRRKSESPVQNRSGDFIDEMASVGLTNLSIDELIKMKTHGVTAGFVRGLHALGYNNLTPKTLTSLRIYNVTPAYIEAMTALGYQGLTLKDLINARIYSVTPEYVKAIREAGYPALSLGQMVSFRIYNVTPQFVRTARSRLGDLTPRQLISLKISGVLEKVDDKKKDQK